MEHPHQCPLEVARYFVEFMLTCAITMTHNIEGTYNIDPERVGVHGHSYGGYMSLLCIGRRPDIFKVVVSGAPVTCWEVYDTGYTERYIGTPQEFPAVYNTGSVCKLAGDFPDEPNRVLICHGLIDENVHFTNTVSCVVCWW